MQMVDGKKLCFYYDKEMIKPFLSIDWNKIVCVNKRQVERNDLYTFSIHYYIGTNSGKLIELRLKCISRSEVDDWVKKFNGIKDLRIQKHRFVEYQGESRYEDVIKQSYMLNPKEYYIKLYKSTMLMYIYLKKSFFKQFKKRFGRKGYRVNEIISPKDVITQIINTPSANRRASYITDNEKQPLVVRQHTHSNVLDAADIDVVVMVDGVSPMVSLYLIL
jgi:hypothetical protein